MSYRIWKIGAPTRRGDLLWWPVFERFDPYGTPDGPVIAYCSGPARPRKGRFSSERAHELIDSLPREYDGSPFHTDDDE